MNSIIKNNMTVSVYMVTYNHEKYIAQAIEGVLIQKTSFPIELIIGEDCSTDRTRTICEEYASKHSLIKLLLSEKNMGAMANFIRTLSACGGKYIAFCEGDDYWTDPYKLQKQVDFLEANPEYALCFHKIKILLKSGKLIDDFITKVPKNTTTIKDLAKHGNYIHTPSVVLKNDFTCPSWFLNCPIGDYPLYFISVGDKKIKHLDETMAVYRFGVGMLTSKPSHQIMLAMFLTTREIIKNYSDEAIKKLLMKANQKKLYYFLYRFLVMKEISSDQLDNFLSRYYSSISDKPFYELVADLMLNWPLLLLVFIKQFIKTKYSCLKKILFRQKAQ